jgi:DNA-binding response OmpR family regulator
VTHRTHENKFVPVTRFVTVASRSVGKHGDMDVSSMQPLRASLIPSPIEPDALVLDPTARVLRGPLGETALTGRALRAAERLMRQPGAYVSHEELLGAIYRDADGQPDFAGDCLRATMVQLRAAVMRVAGDAIGVKVARSIGYTLSVTRR